MVSCSKIPRSSSELETASYDVLVKLQSCEPPELYLGIVVRQST